MDAFEHNEKDLSKLVGLYALISRMRVRSSPRIVEHADKVAQVVIETYLGPNGTFRDVLEIMDNESMNPLRQFSEACREELESCRRYSVSRTGLPNSAEGQGCSASLGANRLGRCSGDIERLQSARFVGSATRSQGFG